MFSYNRSRHVYWNFHRSSINMAKYETFSYNRSRHVHGIFHRSASNLVKCDMIIYRFWFRYLYGNSADIFVKFSEKSLSNVYILFSISMYIFLYIFLKNEFLPILKKLLESVQLWSGFYWLLNFLFFHIVKCSGQKYIV